MLFQTCMSFCLLSNTKEYIFFLSLQWKAIGSCVILDAFIVDKNSSKYFLSFSTKVIKVYRFGTTWGCVIVFKLSLLRPYNCITSMSRKYDTTVSIKVHTHTLNWEYILHSSQKGKMESIPLISFTRPQVLCSVYVLVYICFCLCRLYRGFRGQGEL